MKIRRRRGRKGENSPVCPSPTRPWLGGEKAQPEAAAFLAWMLTAPECCCEQAEVQGWPTSDQWIGRPPDLI
ncbi:leucine-rich repeat extensin-like protein 7 [Iris pallida]|uniref:Leucine-rich repeat extensin-like protein 7 n=1 Tax=Iris pallida TaxID=29817 RepID=A0AAX6FW29_IRIPA|nr:leucine-rich repeat extensin-like protein 7 [Iris pallida]KAJ6820487.1 leucine-rich repeat extensin-like protein 7 [Iris pallida]